MCKVAAIELTERPNAQVDSTDGDWYTTKMKLRVMLRYGESPYKTYLYGEFLKLYNGGQGNSIFTTGITVSNRRHV
jgi:hypothetical protein